MIKTPDNNKDKDVLIAQAKEWYSKQDYSPEYPLFKIMADFALNNTADQSRVIEVILNRIEELEVVASSLYLGHDDGKEQFDMYKAVYLDKDETNS